MSEGHETGDRAEFLARIADRQGRSADPGPHRPPDPPDRVPEVQVRALDGIGPGDRSGLFRVFRAEAERVDAVVHVSTVGDAVETIIRTHDVASAVVPAEPAVAPVRAELERQGVRAGPPEQEAAAAADLGVTGAIAGIAATGSVVVDADLAGGRATSLLPRVHLCVLDEADIVAGTADVLRRPPRPRPAHRVLVTGPSRTGDIEQILTLGAHGPVALHILVV